MSTNFNAVALAFAERLPVCLAGGVAIVGLAWTMLRVAPRRNPRERFGVWFGALIAIAALLLLGGVPAHAPGSVATGAARHALFEVPASWAVYGFVAWLVIVCVTLVRIGVGLWQLGRLKRSCVEIDQNQLDPELVTCLAESPRRVFLCISERATCPTAMGILGRAQVVLPSWTVQELSVVDLKQVVLHELAHLQRWDDWTNLAQKVLRALLFFHPLVWWVETKLTLEREMACDDLVLRHTQDPRAYAECLARLVEKSFARRTLALAQAAVGKLQQTSLRVARILHLGRPSESRGLLPAAAFVIISSFAGLFIIHAPNIIAFDEPQPLATISQVRAHSLVPAKEAVAQLNGSHAAHLVSTVAHASVESPNSARNNISVTTRHDFDLAARNHLELTTARAMQPERQTSPRAIKATYVAHDQQIQAPGAKCRTTRAIQRPAVVEQPAIVQQAIVQEATFVIVNNAFNGNQAVIWHVVWRVASVPDQHSIRKPTGATKT